jgi:pyruvate dehydrogenase E1 component alpha subunit
MKEYSNNFLLQLYRTMLRIRLCEESLVEPIVNREIFCPCHLYSGEEAIAAGIGAALKVSDYVFGTHRSHGHYLAKGGAMKTMVAEIYCKESGCSHGRGGSMHLVAPDVGMLGAAPIVAGTISLALGAALTAQIKKDKRVAVSFFGDGATGEGVLYESMNFAALKKLPIIFACENNFYSTHLPIKECRAKKDIYTIGIPFGIKSLQLDGNNVLEVYHIAKKAIADCRNGKGPYFIEFLTYRYRGHVGPDDNIQGSRTDIRPQNEIRSWLKRDPIIRLEKYLVKKNILNIRKMNAIKLMIQQEVEEAHIFARQSRYPVKEEVAHYVFK